MKKFLYIIGITLVLTVSVCSCSLRAKAASQSKDKTNGTGKTLVVYFSHQVPFEVDGVTGASYVPVNGSYKSSTQYIAQYIQEKTGGDIFRIDVENGHYPTTYEPLAEVAKKEHDEHFLPELTSQINNLSEYSTIIIGYPIWWYDMPMAVYSFFDNYDLSGKRIAVFTTHLGSGLSGTISIIEKLESKAEVIKEGYSCNGNEVAGKEKAIDEWLKKLGY